MAAQQTDQSWVFDTRDLVRRPGTMREASRRVDVTEPLGTDVIAVPAGQQVALELRMESVVEGVLASGSAQATAVGECVRCLDAVELALDVPFMELFAYPDRAAHHSKVAGKGQEDPSTAEEEYELDDDQMDLQEIVRDAVVTSLPFQPVCRDDCPGLCAECGARLADDPEHHHDLIDPRWAALAELASPSDEHEKRI